MILYHGSNVTVSDIDLTMCRPYKDFGKGFYLTNIKEQAILMANRVKRIYGGERHVSIFNFDESIYEDNSAHILSFTEATADWAVFVMNNRSHEENNITDKLCNKDNKYDMVFGPVADDNIAYLFRTYADGLIEMDKLLHGLKYKDLSVQYSFHTQKSLDYLTFCEDLYG